MKQTFQFSKRDTQGWFKWCPLLRESTSTNYMSLALFWMYSSINMLTALVISELAFGRRLICLFGMGITYVTTAIYLHGL